MLPRTSQGLYLLQRVRDEAHRFAIAYHRQKRSRSMTRSVLDDVPGLGPTRRAALLRALRLGEEAAGGGRGGDRDGARGSGRRPRVAVVEALGQATSQAGEKQAASAAPAVGEPSTRRPASCWTADRARVISLCEDARA